MTTRGAKAALNDSPPKLFMLLQKREIRELNNHLFKTAEVGSRETSLQLIRVSGHDFRI